MSKIPFTLATVAVAAMQAASPYSDVVAVLRPSISFDTVYGAAPRQGAYYVMYEEEPLQLTLEISNWAREPRVLLTHSNAPSAGIAFNITRGGVPLNMNIEIVGDVYERGPGTDFRIQWTEQIDFPEKYSLIVEAAVPQLQAGLYEIDLRTTLTDGDLRPLRPQGTVLPIEVRAASDGERTELLRRRALRAYLGKDFAATERRVGQLLAESPNNFSAFAIRGNVAMAEGRRHDAADHYDRAIAILESGSDVEFLKWVSPQKAQESIDALRQLRRSAGR